MEDVASLHTENSITMAAPPDLVFDLAQRVERWPLILDHYRYVRLLSRSWDRGPERRLVRMGASRDGIPVSWTAVQELRPEERCVLYHHLTGATKEMDVVWRIQDDLMGTLVTIQHDLDSPYWWLRSRAARYVVGKVFVVNIADRTLRGIKRQAELLARTGVRQ